MDELQPRTSQGRALTAYVTSVILMLVTPGQEPELVLRELQRRVRATERQAVDEHFEAERERTGATR